MSDSQRQADLMDRERQRIERMARRDIKRVANAMRVEGLRRFRNGGNVVEAAIEASAELENTMTDALVASHLTARRRMMITAGKAISRSNVGLIGAFDGAIEFLNQRLNLSPEQIRQLRLMYGPVAVRAIDEANDVLERRVQTAVRDVSREGLHVDAGMSRVRQAFESSGVSVENPWLYEQVFRTQTQVAYAAGRDQAAEDPAIAEIQWGWEYVTVGDDRVRPSHVPLDGMRAPVDDPIWRTHKPPNGYACRCSLIPVFKTDAEAVTRRAPTTSVVDGMTVQPGPDDGWDFEPGQLFKDTIRVRALSASACACCKP